MMKFPLPRAPFPPVHLTDGEQTAIVDLADMFVQQTLSDYEYHMEVDGGVVDETRWKLFKQFENVVAYQDRQALEARKRKATLAGFNDRSSVDGMGGEGSGRARDLQKLLWFGTIAGDLDDLMFGVINPTAEQAMVKSAYVGNNVMDFAVLTAVVHPTPDDPFRGLQIKWAVNGGPTVTRKIVRPRDFIYLESTGMTRSSTGERIGYHILHSIEMPGAPELHEHKIVRGNMTLYHLYRQKSDGVVETYVKAFIDVLGDMPASVATIMSAKGVVSVWKLEEYSQLKKLNWMLQYRKHHGAYTTAHTSSRGCGVCHKDLRSSLVRKKACRICQTCICSKCAVAKKMFYMSPLTRVVLQRSMTFCINCVRAARETNGRAIAVQALKCDEPFGSDTFDGSSIMGTSPSYSSISYSY